MKLIDYLPAFDFPLTEDDLLMCAWDGHLVCEKGRFLVSTFQSAKNPGFVHYAIIDADGKQQLLSIRPVLPLFARFSLAERLREFNLSASDFTWTAGSSTPVERLAKDEQVEFVYFLYAGPFVKIGKSSGSPSGRIAELQTGCPYQIELAGYIKGGLPKESALHRKFAAHRARADGEWFVRCPEIEAFIEAHSL